MPTPAQRFAAAKGGVCGAFYANWLTKGRAKFAVGICDGS